MLLVNERIGRYVDDSRQNVDRTQPGPLRTLLADEVVSMRHIFPISLSVEQINAERLVRAVAVAGALVQIR